MLKNRAYKVIAASLAAFAIVVASMSGRGSAQSQPPIPTPFTLTAVGQRLPTLALSGSTQTCSIVIYNSGGGFTLVPQASSDNGSSWATASTVNAGSISATGTFTGNVTGTGVTSFGGVLSALTSGTVSGVEVCGSGNGGSTAAVTVASIPPVTISNTPAVTIQNTPAVIQPDFNATGQSLALQTLNAAITTPTMNGVGVGSWVITGLTGQSATVTTECSGDNGTTWSARNSITGSADVPSMTQTTDGTYNINAAGCTKARLRVSVAGNTTNATVAFNFSVASSTDGLSLPLPPGTNAIGNVVQVGPSTAPGAVNSQYQAVVDANGRQASRICDATTSTQCQGVNVSGQAAVQNAPAATASPNAGSALNLLPTAPCANNAGTTNCQSVNAAQQGVVAVASPNVSNASDAVATGSTNLPTAAYHFLWNGATYDRARSTQAFGGTNTGITASDMCSVTANNCATVSSIGNGDGNSINNGALTTGSYNFMFNGTGWDRAIVCPNQTVVNVSSATTTSIVAVSGTKAIYVCSYSLYIVSGTLPSFVIEGGTGAACVTTQAPLTGTFGGIAGAVGELFNSPPSANGPVLRTAASSALCLVSGGTTPNIQGFIQWAQF